MCNRSVQQSLTVRMCTSGAWEDSTVEDVPDHAHLEDTLLADTHQADILQTPEEVLQVGDRPGTPVVALAAAPDPFPGADLALPCPPLAEGDLLAQPHQLQGDLNTVTLLWLCKNCCRSCLSAQVSSCYSKTAQLYYKPCFGCLCSMVWLATACVSRV